jgi:hypothetical protein
VINITDTPFSSPGKLHIIRDTGNGPPGVPTICAVRK